MLAMSPLYNSISFLPLPRCLLSFNASISSLSHCFFRVLNELTCILYTFMVLSHKYPTIMISTRWCLLLGADEVDALYVYITVMNYFPVWTLVKADGQKAMNKCQPCIRVSTGVLRNAKKSFRDCLDIIKKLHQLGRQICLGSRGGIPIFPPI